MVIYVLLNVQNKIVEVIYCGKKKDINLDIEKLTCQKCENTIDNTKVIFTRQTMRKTPPDILFTTTEMLNQNLSEARFRKLFGIVKTRYKPQMILLDEVHTYNSSHGAQVAFLIRRLRELIKSKITCGRLQLL